MNEVIRTIQNHRSIRQYLPQEIPQDILYSILKSAQAMPSSINGQQVSVIVVRDPVKKEKIAELAGGQTWIAQAPVFLVFVADFYKTSLAGLKTGQPQIIHESREGEIVGTFDAGLAMGGAIVAAESLGLGVVPIGGIRRNPAEMIKLLKLPALTYPVAGLVVGYPADPSAQKPRMGLEAYVHDEEYNPEAVSEAVDIYDKTMEEYYTSRGDKDTNWSKGIAETYKRVYFPLVHPTLKDQGFSGDK